MHCSYIRLQANKARSVVATVRHGCVLVRRKTASHAHILVCLCCLLCQWLAGIHNCRASSFRGTANKGAGVTQHHQVCQHKVDNTHAAPSVAYLTSHVTVFHPCATNLLATAFPRAPPLPSTKALLAADAVVVERHCPAAAPTEEVNNRRAANMVVEEKSCCECGWATTRSSLTRCPKPHTHTHTPSPLLLWHHHGVGW